jgi:hypothetical protein
MDSLKQFRKLFSPYKKWYFGNSISLLSWEDCVKLLSSVFSELPGNTAEESGIARNKIFTGRLGKLEEHRYLLRKTRRKLCLRKSRKTVENCFPQSSQSFLGTLQRSQKHPGTKPSPEDRGSLRNTDIFSGRPEENFV